jgi:hypothetical protein
MVGHLKNGSPTFAQVPNRITNVEFIIVSPTIANTMLAVGVLSFKCFCSASDGNGIFSN